MIESHNAEIGAASKRGSRGEHRVDHQQQRTPSPPVSDPDDEGSDGEPASKKIKVDESVYAWIASRKDKCTVLRDNHAKTLKLIEAIRKQLDGPSSFSHQRSRLPRAPRL
jgi:hypothetical protein